MTGALTTPDALLIGVTVLSGGIAAFAVTTVVREMTRTAGVRSRARSKLQPLSEALGQRLDKVDLDALAGRIDDRLEYLNSGKESEQDARADRVEPFLASNRKLVAALRPAHESVMSMSMEELAFTRPDEDAAIAGLIRAVAAYDELAHQVDRVRGRRE
jgi:hypothetical protein